MKDLKEEPWGHFFCRIPQGGGDILVKMTKSDLELPKRHAHDGVESAFEEIVRTWLRVKSHRSLKLPSYSSVSITLPASS